MTKVSCILAAHNEELIIEKTIRSLFAQTLQPFEVIVATDNCTDRTVAILQSLRDEFGSTLQFFSTVNNRDKKGGALNQAFPLISPEAEFVLQMDADTILDDRLLEEAIEEFDTNELLGGVCSRCTALPFPGGSWWNWVLWKLQHIEYGSYDSLRVEKYGKTQILSGAVTVFRREVLDSIREWKGYVWSTGLVEDYTLSLDVQEIGWQIGVGLGMFSYTDTMPTLSMLYRQRDRWYTGAFVELSKRGLSQVTFPYIRGFVLFFLMFGIQLLALTIILSIVMSDIPFQWSVWGMISLGVVWASKIPRIKYVQPLKWYDILIIVTFVPEELYILCRNLLMVFCFLKFLIKPTEVW